MRRPDAISCPGCGRPIPRPENYEDKGGWLEAAAWCQACGGSALVLETPLTYGPRWYAQVASEFDKVSVMGLVLEPEQIEGMYAQAYPSAEACAMEPDGDSEEVIEKEAARRVALAVAILAYGEHFLHATFKEEEKKEQQPPIQQPRRHDYLIARFDVTELSDEERGHLAGEITVQAESSEHHPDVPSPELIWDDDHAARPRRTVDLVREAYLLDPTVSNEQYGRLMEEADLQDQQREWTAEAAPSREV